MTDTQKMIEEEADRYANSEWESQEVKSFGEILGKSSFDIEKLISENDFKAGANFALTQLQYANRWRKVSEELPEMGFRVLIKNEFNVVFLGYIDTIGDWRHCLTNERIKFKIEEWKPIE